MPLFKLPKTRSTKSQDKAIAMRQVKQPVPSIKGGTGLLDRIEQIKQMVDRSLGQYKDKYLYITNEEVLHDYITECIGNGYIAIDTETDGLDPLQNTMAGPCIYTYGQKGSYIPVNHISYITRQRVPGQLDSEFVKKEFKRLIDAKPEIDMFNAKFDIRVLRHFGLPDIYCTWDGYLAGRLLNENELEGNLKALHNKYCLDGKGDAFRFEDLFKGIPFTMIPFNVGYLYAAHDPVITSELNAYQRKHLLANSKRQDIRDMYWVFENIEMPCVPVVADMEDNGILIDTNYAQELSIKYNEKLDEQIKVFNEACEPYKAKINKAREAGAKIDNPINIGSPTQLAILFYDILKIDPPDKKSPRGTGEEILQKIDNPIAKAILDFRETQKLLSTYIDKLPECVNPNDGRIHCSFNQYGAKTGRMSSSDPNLQNIPSHNKDIRKMFVASPGYLLMSSDFSQQEPKCLASLCKKAGDSQMYDTFMAGKDLYCEIASKAFNKTYEECKEFNPDGTTNKAGKERRTQAKSILLGVLYGRGEKSIGEQLGCSEKKAKEIKESVFKGFPAIKKFEQDSLDMAYELGYVTTVCGRKRRLPDLQLDEYEFKWENGRPVDNDVLDFDDVEQEVSNEVPESVQNKYRKKLQNAWFKEKIAIKQEAKKEGLLIIDNGGKIADAQRQCVNSRIQGSAADLTKLAMIRLNNNQELKKLGFRLLIPVHDEVIAECPEENIKQCSKLLAQTMSQAAEEILKMPIKCDVEITKEWYGKEITI